MTGFFKKKGLKFYVLKSRFSFLEKKNVKAKSLKKGNEDYDLQFTVQFVCDNKKRAKTKMKKLKFKHIIFHFKLKRCIKIYISSL
jgi:hypothetical protein